MLIYCSRVGVKCRRVGLLAAVATGLLVAAGCSSTTVTVVGHERPAIAHQLVNIYRAPPKNFEVVAELQTDAKNWTSQADMEEAMEVFKAKAAKVGANGVLILSVRAERNGHPVDVGSGPYIEAEVGELPSQIVRAEAIFVPPSP